MTNVEALVAEFDQEMATTRKSLERVPDGKFAWQPHAKSMTMGRLATHIAEIPWWGTVTIKDDSFDMAPPGGPAYVSPALATREELLAFFDKNVAGAHAELAGTADAKLTTPWSLLNAGQTVMTMPRAAVIRTFVLSHVIHHRAQLGVYLRLNDIPVPSVYGPSADESGM